MRSMGNGWRKWTAALAACLMLVMSSGCYVVKLVEVWGGTTLTSEDGGYSLTLTAGWADAAGMLNDYAVLEAAMTSRERYVMVIPYDKEDVGDRTLEDVTELLIAEIADGSQDGVVSGRAAVQIDGRSGYRPGGRNGGGTRLHLLDLLYGNRRAVCGNRRLDAGRYGGGQQGGHPDGDAFPAGKLNESRFSPNETRMQEAPALRPGLPA